MIFQTRLAALADRVHQWTQIFDGEAARLLTPQDTYIIRGCLDVFSPIEQGIVAMLDSDRLSIEGLYFIPAHRRMLAEHIIAMNILVLIFYPFYPGLDVEAGKALVSITDQLYREGIVLFNYAKMYYSADLYP